MRGSAMATIVATLVLAACTGGQSRQAAEAGVGEFHRQYNAANDHAIYAGASQQFRNSDSEQHFLEIIGAVRARLGQMQHADEGGWHLNYNNGVTTMTLNYNTGFEHGAATEQFVYLIENDGAKLLSWDLHSDALRGPAPSPGK